MNPIKLSFQSENLVVDGISFNIPGSDDPKYIAEYLFQKLNFNSNFAKGKKGISEPWFDSPQNEHRVYFKQFEYNPSSDSFWEGTVITFYGTDATQIYKLIQEHKLDWNILKSQIRKLEFEEILEKRPSIEQLAAHRLHPLCHFGTLHHVCGRN